MRRAVAHPETFPGRDPEGIADDSQPMEQMTNSLFLMPIVSIVSFVGLCSGNPQPSGGVR